jgi:hypothetical protein
MAIVSAVSGALGKRLQELQRWLDPDSAGAMPPHIPIVGPFDASPSFLPLEQHVQQVCRETAPFDVSFGELVIGEQEAHLRLERGQAGLEALRGALLDGKYAPRVKGQTYEPRAIAGRVVEQAGGAVERWYSKAVSGDYLLQRVELMARYPGGEWYERDFYTLDKAASP